MNHTVHLQPGSLGLVSLSEAASRADAQGRVFHINVENYAEGNALKYKVGEDMWSPPVWGSPVEDKCDRRCPAGNRSRNHWTDCSAWDGEEPHPIDEYQPEGDPMFVVESEGFVLYDEVVINGHTYRQVKGITAR